MITDESERIAVSQEGGFYQPRGVMDNPSDCILWMANNSPKAERDWCAYDNGSYIKFLKILIKAIKIAKWQVAEKGHTISPREGLA